jgi:predicted nuclease with TOPRIM domain
MEENIKEIYNGLLFEKGKLVHELEKLQFKLNTINKKLIEIEANNGSTTDRRTEADQKTTG